MRTIFIRILPTFGAKHKGIVDIWGLNMLLELLIINYLI